MNAIPKKSPQTVRALAIAFKIVATIEGVGIVCLFINELIVEVYSHRFMDPVFVFVVLFISLLAVTPNLWIVRSYILFHICLVIALLPFIFSVFGFFSTLGSGSAWNLETIFGAITYMSLLLAWPLSLILSRVRFKRGESFWFA